MYCKICQKKVIVISINPGAAQEGALDGVYQEAKKDGVLLLFNSPPFGPYRCPDCHSELAQEANL